jgi:hypothetical protein
VFAALALAATLTLPGVSRATDLSGCWSGTWNSCQTGHKGPLNAEFVRLNDSQYEVFFTGRFFKFIPFRYSVVMNAVEQNGVVYLSGSQNLGKRAGVFSFSATATCTCFNANYTSCRDNGQFKMSRVSGCCK